MAEEALGLIARVLGVLVRVLAEFFLYGFLYTTGRIGLPLLTFGWWRVIPLTDHQSDTGRGIKRQPDGTLLVDSDMAMFFGLLIWVLIGLLAFMANWLV